MNASPPADGERPDSVPASPVFRDPAADECRFFTDVIPASGPDSELVLNIVRAGSFLYERVADNLRCHGLSEAQFNVLVALEVAAPDGLTMAALARRMLVSRAGMSGVLKGMENRGWVCRKPMLDDARKKRVQVTEAGLAALAAVLPSHLEVVEQTVGRCFTCDEKNQLVALLTRLRCEMATERSVRKKLPLRKNPDL